MHDPATDEELSTFFSQASQADPDIGVSDTAPRQKSLKGKHHLNQLLLSHCQQPQYSFQMHKCGKAVCDFGLCKPPHLPTDPFKSLSWLPDPMKDEANPGHYKQYHQLKGTATTDEHRPSLQKQGSRTVEAKKQRCCRALFTAQRVRQVVKCGECAKPRCIYSQTTLPTADMALLTSALSDVEYSCGSPFLPDGHPLRGEVFVRMVLRCMDTVELAYYLCKLNLPGVCCYCANDDASKPQEFQAKYFTVLPICQACQSVKAVVTRMPKAGSKRKRASE